MTLETCGRVSAALAGLGSLIVSLSGGDPFLHAELPAVLRTLSADHFPLLTTNGWLVTRERAREAWQAGLEGATVLMWDAEPAGHDAETGLPGSHARAVAALDAFASERRRAGQRVNVKARFRAGDAEASRRIEALCRLAGAHGATLSVEPSFPLSAEAARGIGESLLALKRRERSLRSSPYFLERLDEAVTGGVPGCRAGRAFLNVNHEGKASKCVEFQGSSDLVGDLSREDARAVVARLREEQAHNDCRACWYASRGEVEALYGVRGFMAAVPLLFRA